MTILIGDRGYTYPYEFAARGEPGFDGMPGRKGMFLKCPK